MNKDKEKGVEKYKTPIVHININSLVDKLELIVPDGVSPEELERYQGIADLVRAGVEAKMLRCVSNLTEPS